MAGTTRREILEAHQLALAPPVLQREFWRRYNHSKKNDRRQPVSVSHLISKVLSSGATKPVDRGLQELQDAWNRLVSAHSRALSCVETFINGRLTIRVNGGASKFVISREIGRHAVAALNRFMGAQKVKKIEFRVVSTGHGMGDPQFLGKPQKFDWVVRS